MVFRSQSVGLRLKIHGISLGLLWRVVTRTGIDYQKGSHQFLNWWQQYATGILHLDGFDSHSNKQKRDWLKPVSFFGELRNLGHKYYALIRRQFQVRS